MKLQYILVFTLASCDSGPINKTPPDVEAAAFLNALRVKFTGVSCAQGDTDHDGYVTCTVAVPDGPMVSVQCGALNAGEFGESPYTSGCKQIVDRNAPVILRAQ